MPRPLVGEIFFGDLTTAFAGVFAAAFGEVEHSKKRIFGEGNCGFV
jgi:hypothetical protein